MEVIQPLFLILLMSNTFNLENLTSSVDIEQRRVSASQILYKSTKRLQPRSSTDKHGNSQCRHHQRIKHQFNSLICLRLEQNRHHHTPQSLDGSTHNSRNLPVCVLRVQCRSMFLGDGIKEYLRQNRESRWERGWWVLC